MFIAEFLIQSEWVAMGATDEGGQFLAPEAGSSPVAVSFVRSEVKPPQMPITLIAEAKDRATLFATLRIECQDQ